MYDPLTSLTSVKTWMKISTDADNAAVAQIIPRASELIGKYCSRENLGAILTYSENYFPKRRMFNGQDWNLVLRHYPVTTLTSVILNGVTLTLLGSNDLQTGTSGVYLAVESQEPRKLMFRGVVASAPGVVQVNYEAGYARNSVPLGLQQACDQYVGEILRSSGFIGLKSLGVAQETTTYDMGGDWGMSKRVQSMLVPYMNKIPFMMQ